GPASIGGRERRTAFLAGTGNGFTRVATWPGRLASGPRHATRTTMVPRAERTCFRPAYTFLTRKREAKNPLSAVQAGGAFRPCQTAGWAKTRRAHRPPGLAGSARPPPPRPVRRRCGDAPGPGC